MTDHFSFKQIMIMVCTGAIIFLTFIGLIAFIGLTIQRNDSSVTTRICSDAESRCKVYTIEVKNAEITGKTLSDLSERIINALNEQQKLNDTRLK